MHAEPVCLRAHMDDRWSASRELPSVPPGLSSTTYVILAIISKYECVEEKAHRAARVDVASQDTPATSTSCAHESIHHVQRGIMPIRLSLPHLDDEILSGCEEDVSSIQDGSSGTSQRGTGRMVRSSSFWRRSQRSSGS